MTASPQGRHPLDGIDFHGDLPWTAQIDWAHAVINALRYGVTAEVLASACRQGDEVLLKQGWLGEQPD